MQFKNGVIIGLMLAGCSNQPATENKTPFWKQIIIDDIALLKAQKWSIDKNTSIEEDVENQLIQLPNWENELNSILNLDDNATTYTQNADSNGLLKITYYYPTDSQNMVKQISVNTLAGKTQVIEIQTQSSNWIVNRKTKYSYMPQKGYSIQMEEEYLWTSAKQVNINAEFKKTP